MTNLKASIEVALVDEVSANAARIEAALGEIEQSAEAAGAEGAASMAALESAAGRAATSMAATGGQSANATSALSGATATTAALAGATEDAAASSGGFLKNIFSVTDAQKKAGRAGAEQLNLITELALGFSNMSPATRQLGVDMAGAGNNSFALAGALGPLGIAVAVAAAALPTAIKYFRDMGGEARDAATAAREVTAAINEQASAARELRQAREQRRSLETGEADSEDIEDGIAGQRVAYDEARAELRARQNNDIGVMFERVPELFSDVGSAISQGSFAPIRDGEARRQRAIRDRANTARVQAALFRDQGLPVARAREEREAREAQASESSSQATAAAEQLEAEVSRLPGLSERERARLQAGASEGRIPRAIAAQLPEADRARLFEASTRTIQTRQLAERDEEAARRPVVREVDVRRGVEDSESPGVLLRAGEVGGPGGLRSGGADQIVAARGDDPTAEVQRRAADVQQSAAERQERAAQAFENGARIMVEVARTQAASGGRDGVLGGGE